MRRQKNRIIIKETKHKKDTLKESILSILNKYSDESNNSTSQLISEIKCILNQYN